MLRWLGPQKANQPNDGQADPIPNVLQDEEVTDDPLAAIDAHRRGLSQIYSVSRSVLLPRVTLKNTSNTCPNGGGVNPLFREVSDQVPPPKTTSRQRSPHPGEKSNSSGYSSTFDSLYCETKLREDTLNIIQQNPNFVKSIKVPSRAVKNKHSSPSSGSSGGGTLTTIPEGKVDVPIPKPIWPDVEVDTKINHDSLVDDALLLYTSLSQVSDHRKHLDNCVDVSVKDILVDLLNNINATIEGTGLTHEEMLKQVNERIVSSIEALRMSTEEEMKKLCINLTNCRKINSVLKAFSNASSSGNSSQMSPQWGSGRVRTLSNDTEDFYHTASASSSSGFSDLHALPVFIHEDLSSVPNGMRNAMIYGTLCRGRVNSLGAKTREEAPKKISLRAVNDNKPSVWEQYYGVRATGDQGEYSGKPTDVPIFPGGRPEADFTLNVPRSELLSKRMKQDKKWRCRCRLLTSFLGLVFFLLSVMAVSLMLTKGKRMFGSMM